HPRDARVRPLRQLVAVLDVALLQRGLALEPLLCIHHHGAQLPAAERPAAEAEPHVSEQHGPARIEPDCEGAQREQRRCEHEQDRRPDDIHGALQDAAGAPPALGSRMPQRHCPVIVHQLHTSPTSRAREQTMTAPASAPPASRRSAAARVAASHVVRPCRTTSITGAPSAAAAAAPENRSSAGAACTGGAPSSAPRRSASSAANAAPSARAASTASAGSSAVASVNRVRSEEHTSELQSRENLV